MYGLQIETNIATLVLLNEVAPDKLAACGHLKDKLLFLLINYVYQSGPAILLLAQPTGIRSLQIF